ncbi:MAG: amidohydrolase [Treponema sp.]|jgi:predicted amidohydrolase YtcJ|nr:amidohydrolase [Treponema sp.]
MVRLIYNARIYRGRGLFCEALRIEDGKIRAAGGSAEILADAPAGAERIDAEGALALPGFHDSHLHLQMLGLRAGMIDCGGADSPDEVIRRGRELIGRLKPEPGTYVLGAGLNPDLFTNEKRDLTREDLDRISASHPLIITRHCGHIIYCNSLTLRMAGLGEAAPEVEGGVIEKDGKGRPTGVLRENAGALARGPIPPLTGRELRANLRLAMEKALSLGITALGSNDPQTPAEFDRIVKAYQEIYREGGEGGPRVTLQCGISGKEGNLEALWERDALTGRVLREIPGRGIFLKVGPLKLFLDGTLGGQTAWMKAPYRDKPETRGFPVLEEAFFRALIRRAASRGMQVITHTIGNAAMEAAISALEQVSSPGHNPLRHGIVHCQITERAQLERMARNRILALVQPVFLADDMYVLENRVGPELAASSYAWGTMERLGVPVSYGTDAPVSDLNPLLGLSWAVTRQDPGRGFLPREGFYPAERVDLAAAIDAYTAGSAWANFNESLQGRVEPGYWADLAFIDRDIFSLPAEEIHRARVIRTMIAGETVWEGPPGRFSPPIVHSSQGEVVDFLAATNRL